MRRSPRWLRPCLAVHRRELECGLRADRRAEAITRRQLDEFLDLGWTATAVDSTSVDQRYEQLLVETNRDSRLLYGYALVKIKLRKYAEASKLVDEVLDADAKNQNVRRTKIWLSVILKNYGQALVALEKSANFLAPEPKSGSEVEDPALAQVRFLGRVFGFLEGPVSDQAPQDSAAALRRKIAAKWGESGRRPFATAVTR